jgi:SET domain-containing protein
MAKDFGDVEVRESGIKQFLDGLGVFAKKDFKKGAIVVKWKLRIITREEYEKLPKEERYQFTHKRNNQIIFYPEPERHVNRHENPNVYPDFDKEADVALRDIKKGEELSIPKNVTEDFGNK